MRWWRKRWEESSQNTSFRRRVRVQEQRAQKYNRFLRGCQVACMIYGHVESTGSVGFVQYLLTGWWRPGSRYKMGSDLIGKQVRCLQKRPGRLVQEQIKRFRSTKNWIDMSGRSQSRLSRKLGWVSTNRSTRWRWRLNVNTLNFKFTSACRKKNHTRYHWILLMWPGQVTQIWMWYKLLECWRESNFVRFVDRIYEFMLWSEKFRPGYVWSGEA